LSDLTDFSLGRILLLKFLWDNHSSLLSSEHDFLQTLKRVCNGTSAVSNGGPVQRDSRKSEMQNSRGGNNFQYQRNGFQDACTKLPAYSAPYGKEHFSHTWSIQKNEIVE
jgi:hypothetical protein